MRNERQIKATYVIIIIIIILIQFLFMCKLNNPDASYKVSRV
jgi:hypothetical protein